MILSVIAFLLSIVPSVLIFILLKKRHKEDLLYKKSCNIAFISGLISALPIILVSGTLFIINGILRLTLLKDVNILVYKAIYTFIVLALAEEAVKYIAFRIILKKTAYVYSMADVVAVMVIIGAGFGLIEDIPYAIGADPITMLVRGVTMGHVGYGFIMGWFYGKQLHTGKKRFGILALALPWLLHGLYDFSLIPELIELNDNLVLIAFFLALADIAAVVLMIIYFIRSHKKEIAADSE